MADRRGRLKADQIVLLRFESEAETSSTLLQDRHSSCSSKFRCVTEIVALQEAPTYVALSYAWGDASITKPIYMDGDQVQVTSNLQSAMIHIRSRVEKTEALWVDAICINQKDDVEKSEQVAHMHDVYANAVKVIVWLGPTEDSQHADIALDWMMSFGERATRFSIGLGNGPNIRSLLDRHGNTIPNDDDSSEAIDLKLQRLIFADQLEKSLNVNDNPNYTVLIDSLQGFMSRTYWERVWIVQEFVLAKKHDFVCGSRALDFWALLCAVRMLRAIRMWHHNTHMPASTSPEDALQRYTKAIPRLSRCVPFLFLRATMKHGDLLYLLRMYGDSKATDSRDRVFAFLGIATDTSTLDVVPDYTKSQVQIYTEVARALLKNGQFDVLGHCSVPSRDVQKLQSWVPDWSCKTPRSCLVTRILPPGAEKSVMETSFRASGSLAQPEIVIPNSHAWHRPLVLSVIIVCRIASVGMPWHADGIGDWWRLDCLTIGKLYSTLQQAAGGF